MARERDHITLANKNHRALVYLMSAKTDGHPEWVATVAFYKAVQVVEAVFATAISVHSNGHDSRIADLKRSQFKEIFKAYRPLYSASLVARYLEDASQKKLEGKGTISRYGSFSDYMSPSDVVEKLLRRKLDVLEQHAVGFLSEEGKVSLERIGKVL